LPIVLPAQQPFTGKIIFMMCKHEIQGRFATFRDFYDDRMKGKSNYVEGRVGHPLSSHFGVEPQQLLGSSNY
jgi:hypothetical protein